MPLFLKLVHTVAVYEGSSSRSMSMQIQKCKKPITIIQMKYKITDRIDCRLKFHCRINIASVQIYPICIDSVMASPHTIWIQNRKNVEYKIIAK